MINAINIVKILTPRLDENLLSTQTQNMISVIEAAEKIINRSRYLREAMTKDLINISSLSRYIKPELEEMLYKEVSHASVIMAINRLSKKIKLSYNPDPIFKEIPDIILNANLVLQNIEGGKNNIKNFLLKITNGENTAIVLKKGKNAKLTNYTPVTSITLSFSEQTSEIQGVFYFFLKSLAWEGIQVLQTVSIKNRLVIIVEEKNSENAFRIIKSLVDKATLPI